MTGDEVSKAAQSIRDMRDRELLELQRQAERMADRYEQAIDDLYARQGRQRCKACDGFGKLQKLDAGYMRKFGLREWNGCEACGGDGHEKAGRGFI